MNRSILSIIHPENLPLFPRQLTSRSFQKGRVKRLTQKPTFSRCDQDLEHCSASLPLSIKLNVWNQKWNCLCMQLIVQDFNFLNSVFSASHYPNKIRIKWRVNLLLLLNFHAHMNTHARTHPNTQTHKERTRHFHRQTLLNEKESQCLHLNPDHCLLSFLPTPSFV